MQFLCYYHSDGPGLYLSPQDSTLHWKTATAMGEDGITTMGWNYPLEHMGVPQKERHFTAKVGVFHGDWYDGAMLYRNWAIRQPWMPGLWRDRKDVPAWMKENMFTIADNNQGSRESFLHFWDLAKASQDEVLGPNQPVLMNWYRYWPHNSLGHYAPNYAEHAWPDFADFTGRMRERNMYPVVYNMFINLKKDTPLWKQAWEQINCMTPGGKPMHKGCPASMTLGAAMRQEVKELVKRFGVKGIYSDLSGCYSQRLGNRDVGYACWAQGGEHAHPVGGGSWFYRKHGEMLSDLRKTARELDPEFVILVENYNEAILRSSDAHLIQPYFQPDISQRVPLLEVVSGDRVKAYGVKPSHVLPGAKKVFDKPEAFPREGIDLAQAFAYGEMVGRFASYTMHRVVTADLDQVATIAYAKRLLSLHKAARPFLVDGRCLRPPKVIYSKGNDTPSCRWNYSVVSAAHAHPDKPDLLWVAVNSRHSQAQSVTLEANGAEYGIPSDGSWEWCELTPSGELHPKGRLAAGAAHISLTLPPLDGALFVLRPQPR